MKKTVRLIIEKNGNILFIKRRKIVNGALKEFYVLPGGEIDDAETDEQTGVREAKEELDIDIKIESFLTEIYVEELDKHERFYFADIVKGTPKNGKGEEFQNQSINSKYGTYEVTSISKKELGTYNILPIEIKDKLVSMYI